MITNFQIEDSIALLIEGKYLDLHNCYKFIGYHHNIDERKFVLTFIKSDGDWVKEDDPKKFIMIHYDVTYADINYSNETYEFQDDYKCLSDITFFPDEVRTINDQIILQKEAKTNDDIIYVFQ